MVTARKDESERFELGAFCDVLCSWYGVRSSYQYNVPVVNHAPVDIAHLVL